MLLSRRVVSGRQSVFIRPLPAASRPWQPTGAFISWRSSPSYSTLPPDRAPNEPRESSESSSTSKSLSSQPSSSSTTDSPSPAETPSSSEPAAPESKSEPEPQPESIPSSPSDAELPSAADSRRSQFTQRFSNVMDNLQNRYVDGLQAFNSITGYSAIEAITANNAHLEKSLSGARARMREARQTYQDTAARQVATQRDMATLLARKASWVQSDKNQFAELLDLDYKLEQDVSDATKAVADAEGEEQRLISAWVAGMSKQYYEHQVYSDRIRRASTWGTWGLMGVNILLFLTLQFVAEPWKRGRLLNSMEEREVKLLDRVDGRLDEGFGQMRGELKGALEAMRPGEPQEATATAVAVGEKEVEVVEAPPLPSWREVVRDPRLLRGPLMEAYHTIKSELRVKDAIALGLQGAIVVLLLRNQ